MIKSNIQVTTDALNLKTSKGKKDHNMKSIIALMNDQ